MYKLLLLMLIFTKLSYAQKILWQEDFETDVLPEGWSVLNIDRSSSVPEIFSSFTFADLGRQDPQSGNFFFKFSFDDANYLNHTNDWLITPLLNNVQNGDTISFWCGAIDRDFTDSLKIWVSTTDSLPESFTMIDHFKVNGPAGSWHKKNYDLSKFSGKNIYFALNYNMFNGGPLGSSTDNLWVDNFIYKGEGLGSNLPESFELRQNFPNPFNPETEIIFTVPGRSNVTIKIYDALGKEIQKIVNGIYEPGSYRINFNSAGLASGVYFYQMIAGEFQDTKKMELIK